MYPERSDTNFIALLLCQHRKDPKSNPVVRRQERVQDPHGERESEPPGQPGSHLLRGVTSVGHCGLSKRQVREKN